MIVSIKHAALAATAFGVLALGSSAMAASTPQSPAHHTPSFHHRTARTDADGRTSHSGRASNQGPGFSSVPNTPPTIQQGLSMVGSIWGPQEEALARTFLTAHGYPTTGVITPALVREVASSLGYPGAPIPTNVRPANPQTNGPVSGPSIGSGHYSANVLPAAFPNPANLSPVTEPSLQSPSAGLQGEFTPTVKTIDGRPVLKAFHMVATSYGPSLADNYPYGPTDAFGQPLQNGMIAVDPRVIPLHTVLYVTGYHDNYLPSGGFLGQAMDTGGAIKGDRVDLFINANSSVINEFGVQEVTVYELGN